MSYVMGNHCVFYVMDDVMFYVILGMWILQVCIHGATR